MLKQEDLLTHFAVDTTLVLTIVLIQMDQCLRIRGRVHLLPQ